MELYVFEWVYVTTSQHSLLLTKLSTPVFVTSNLDNPLLLNPSIINLVY